MNLQTKLEEMRKRCEAAKLGKAIVQRFDNESGEIHYQIELEDVFRDDMIFASVWNHKARAEFVKHSIADMPALLSALQVALGALEDIDSMREEYAGEFVRTEGSEIAAQALVKAEALLLQEGK